MAAEPGGTAVPQEWGTSDKQADRVLAVLADETRRAMAAARDLRGFKEAMRHFYDGWLRVKDGLSCSEAQVGPVQARVESFFDSLVGSAGLGLAPGLLWDEIALGMVSLPRVPTTEMARSVAAARGCGEPEARRLLDSAAGCILAAVGETGECTLTGFGRFVLRPAAAGGAFLRFQVSRALKAALSAGSKPRIEADDLRADPVCARLAAALGQSEEEAAGTLCDLLAALLASLASGERAVEVEGLGTFAISVRRAREGLNPKTGERIEYPATASLRFLREGDVG